MDKAGQRLIIGHAVESRWLTEESGSAAFKGRTRIAQKLQR